MPILVAVRVQFAQHRLRGSLDQRARIGGIDSGRCRGRGRVSAGGTHQPAT